MKTSHHSYLARAISILALTTSAHAAVLIQDNFDNGTGNLNGQGVDVNNIGGTITWVANAGISANGVVTDGVANTANSDFGGVLDLGASFAFQANKTYTLTVDYSGLNKSILFAGFIETFSNATTGRIRTQGDAFTAMQIRYSDPSTDNRIGAYQYLTASINQYGTSPTAAGTSGTATLTLTTNSLTDATFTATGVDTNVAVDLTAYSARYLFLDFEDAATSGSSAATIDSITFEVIPEPSAAALVGLAGVCLLLRRRR